MKDCRLPPFQSADLSDKSKSFWQLVGPGAILVGLAIGSGELILWPKRIEVVLENG